MYCNLLTNFAYAQFIETHSDLNYWMVAGRCDSSFSNYTESEQIRYRNDCNECKINSLCLGQYSLFMDSFICSMISSAVLCFVGFFILFNKKFKKHPYPWLGIACLADAAAFQLDAVGV